MVAISRPSYTPPTFETQMDKQLRLLKSLDGTNAPAPSVADKVFGTGGQTDYWRNIANYGQSAAQTKLGQDKLNFVKDQMSFGNNATTWGLGLSALDTLGGLWSAYQSNKLGKEQIKLGRDELAFGQQAHKDNLQLGIDTQNLTIDQINQQKAMQRDVIAKTRLHQDEGAYAGYQDIAKLSLPA